MMKPDVLNLTKLKPRFGPEPADVGGSCVPSSTGAGSGFKATWFSWEMAGSQRHWFAGACPWAHGEFFGPFPIAGSSLTSQSTSVLAKIPPWWCKPTCVKSVLILCITPLLTASYSDTDPADRGLQGKPSLIFSLLTSGGDYVLIPPALPTPAEILHPAPTLPGSHWSLDPVWTGLLNPLHCDTYIYGKSIPQIHLGWDGRGKG